MRVINADCESWLRQCERYDCIFADPPDNLGLKYANYKDQRADYYDWLELLIRLAVPKAKVTWISYYWRHDLELKYRVRPIAKQHCLQVKTFLWRYTFGQHSATDCGSGFRYLLRLASPSWKPNTSGIHVRSERQAIGDLRANPLGKVPDDVWEFDCDGIWDIPRVTGNSEQRREWHPTQHPEALMERLVLLSGAKSVLDCFGGTGTTLRVCKKLGIDCDHVEMDQGYCENVANELQLTVSRLS